MTKKYDHHWKNPKNWYLNSIYTCKDDPRVVVSKKRVWAGWTFNFAHKSSYYLLVYVLTVAVAPSLYVIINQRIDLIWNAVIVSAILALAVVLACARIGRKTIKDDLSQK